MGTEIPNLEAETLTFDFVEHLEQARQDGIFGADEDDIRNSIESLPDELTGSIEFRTEYDKDMTRGLAVVSGVFRDAVHQAFYGDRRSDPVNWDDFVDRLAMYLLHTPEDDALDFLANLHPEGIIPRLSRSPLGTVFDVNYDIEFDEEGEQATIHIEHASIERWNQILVDVLGDDPMRPRYESFNGDCYNTAQLMEGIDERRTFLIAKRAPMLWHDLLTGHGIGIAVAADEFVDDFRAAVRNLRSRDFGLDTPEVAVILSDKAQKRDAIETLKNMTGDLDDLTFRYWLETYEALSDSVDVSENDYTYYSHNAWNRERNGAIPVTVRLSRLDQYEAGRWERISKLIAYAEAASK